MDVEICDRIADVDHKLRTFSPHALLLSMQLPGEQSWAFLRGLRAGGSRLPVLAFVEQGSERLRSMECGADGYLVRPVRSDEIAARVRALLRSLDPQADAAIRIFDLEIDPATRRVHRAGKPIRLTGREYALLQVLALHRGKICSREFIWERLYPEQESSRSNVVDVFVRYLRGKIDRGYDFPLILTAWGKGYMLRGESNADEEPAA